MKQYNKNFLLNVSFQLLTYLFPLLTLPYISRVLGVDNIGIYSFTYSVVNLYMLAAMLGINNYGNREIAKNRDDPEKRAVTFFSIYGLQLLLGMCAVIVYVIYAWRFCKEYTAIAKIQILFLISACIDINWFYFGLEKFKITISWNLVVKLLSLCCIFLFVKTDCDLWKYTLIMAGCAFLNHAYLFIRLPKFIQWHRVCLKQILSHFKGVLILFIPVLAFGIYRVMDKTMLGMYSSVTELGYYENAERLINIPISIITALGTVMLPYMAHMGGQDKQKMNSMICESMNLAMVLATVMAGGLVLIAHDAAIVIFGAEFAKSGKIIVVLSCTIIASAWANVVRTQYLIPNMKDSIYVRSTIYGAVINLLSNLTFIRLFGAYGACIGTILAEFFIMVYQSAATRKELPQMQFLRQLIRALGNTCMIMMCTFGLTFWIPNIFTRLILKILFAVVLFAILNRSLICTFFGQKEKI